jgi:anti-sigma regulatory factor (Ser/Thr protein kinase)
MNRWSIGYLLLVPGVRAPPPAFVERTFPPEANTVPSARNFVLGVLGAWHLEGENAGLLVSELATNAVVHGRSDYTVRVELLGDVVRVEVADDNPRQPTVSFVSSGSISGLGLWVVSKLAKQWGSRPNGEGKTVFFEIPADSSLG